jgi:hypothetical protein
LFRLGLSFLANFLRFLLVLLGLQSLVKSHGFLAAVMGDPKQNQKGDPKAAVFLQQRTPSSNLPLVMSHGTRFIASVMRDM